MRTNYWSLSPLAHKIRHAFGVAKMPYSATSEGWNTYMSTCADTTLKRAGKWLAEDFLDALQGVYMFVPDKIDSIAYFLSNWKNSNHVLKTRARVGEWKDFDGRISDGMFLGMIDFVEKECFWMWVMCNSETDYFDSDVRAYGRQSYFRRKLFPLRISSDTRAKYGIRWLEFQNQHMEDKSMYNDLIDAYRFAKNRYMYFDAYVESGYTDFFEAHGCSFKVQVPEEIWDKLRALEVDFENDCTKHLTTIVKYRGMLWT